MLAPIYLDHHATTPCDPRVVEAMAPFWNESFGNAASRTHALGWRAAEAVEAAREAVAALVGARPRDVVFTSGATEANNLALLGTLRSRGARGAHIVTCVTEHRAVLDPCAALEREGCAVTRLPVDRDGRLDLDRLRAALARPTQLVSLMHANNEIGVIHPIANIARIVHEHGALLHTDAAQSAGWVPVDVEDLGADLLSLSGHKLYGPKGIGALVLRRRRPSLRLEPILHGGGHERGLRSGTLPVPLCVGFGRACQITAQERPAHAARVLELRERLWRRLREGLEGVWLNGDVERRLPGNLNVSFRGVEGQTLLVSLPELALSTGSACTSANPEPSHVLRSLGLGKDRALGAIRIGIGRSNDDAEIERAAQLLVAGVQRLRSLRASGRPGVRDGGTSQ